MQASKVIVSDDTMMLHKQSTQSPKLRALKEARVKEYIRSKPTGAHIYPVKLVQAAGYNIKDKKNYSAGYAFVTNMVKRGLLTKERVVKSDASIWTIPGDTKVIKPGVSQPVSELPNPVAVSPAPVIDDAPEDDDEIEIDDIVLIRKIEQMAKEFSWKENSDSVREFIKSLK